jgi:ribonuclease R
MNEKVHAPRTVSGRLKVHPDGFGFVVPDDKSEDIHVSARARGAAMDGDRVEVEWWVGARGLEGRVHEVLERGRGKITGIVDKAGKLWRLQPDDPRIIGPVLVRGGPNGAKAGQAVVAQIERYPTSADEGIEVTVLKALGDPDDPRTEIEKILAVADIEEEFPGPVTHAAAHVPDQVRPNEMLDRVDLRRVPFLTIDPETARDFDDAVAVTPLPTGWRLWVAVADVSHYVRPGTAFDEEAQARGCSVYLPNRAIPMLPESLSGHMCSLVPEQDRLAMVVRIDFDNRGTPVDTDFAAAVIHSRARLDYPGVAAALAGDTKGKRKKYEPHLRALEHAMALSQILRQRRRERGALDLDLPEPVVELDRDDPRLVRDIRRSRRDPGERGAYAMIEEFMLAANEAVGESFKKRGEPTLWRVHDAPDATKLEVFAAAAGSYGIPFDAEEARTPKGLTRLLQLLKGHAAEKPLSFQLLRSLKQATYHMMNIGHFGLASSAYLHFTSPIRRYPDVVVHRLLKHRLAALGRPSGGFAPLGDEGPSEIELQRIAADSSFAERKAMEVEREVMDLYRAFFLRDRVGDVFTGTISGVTSFGVFVIVEEPFVEGLVRIEALGDDYFHLDEDGLRLVGSRTGKTFSLGDTVTVEVLSVSVARRKIDFRLHAHEATTQPERRRGKRRAHGDESSQGDAGRERGKRRRPEPKPRPTAAEPATRRRREGHERPIVETARFTRRERKRPDVAEGPPRRERPSKGPSRPSGGRDRKRGRR